MGSYFKKTSTLAAAVAWIALNPSTTQATEIINFSGDGVVTESCCGQLNGYAPKLGQSVRINGTLVVPDNFEGVYAVNSDNFENFRGTVRYGGQSGFVEFPFDNGSYLSVGLFTIKNGKVTDIAYRSHTGDVQYSFLDNDSFWFINYYYGEIRDVYFSGRWSINSSSAQPGVPEPETWVSLVLGFALVGIAARRTSFRLPARRVSRDFRAA